MTDLITEVQDLTDLAFEETEKRPGIGGSFLKAVRIEEGKRVIYKCPDLDPELGFVGHEGVNELVASRLMKKLGIEGAEVRLLRAKVNAGGRQQETWVVRSEDFLKPGQDKISLELFYEGEKREGETPLAFCERRGFEDAVYRMLILDYLILNRDRHGKNMEVIRDKEKREFRLAPLFDHGLSLLFRCRSEADMERLDVMADRPVQCFVGSRSEAENLKLIPEEKWPKLPVLTDSDVDEILSGLSGIMPEIWTEKVKGMLKGRWAVLQEMLLKQMF